MPTLQIITDIVAMAFMGVMLIVVLIAAILAWRLQRKIKRVQQNVQQKVKRARGLMFVIKQLLA